MIADYFIESSPLTLSCHLSEAALQSLSPCQVGLKSVSHQYIKMMESVNLGNIPSSDNAAACP